eukprot:414366_1
MIISSFSNSRFLTLITKRSVESYYQWRGAWSPPQKRDLKNQIPFICPPKYHYEYYSKLLSSSFICQKYEFLLDIILNFCVGELDFSNEFFESDVWNKIQYALNDRKLPSFGLTKSNNSKGKCKFHIHLCGTRSNYTTIKKEHMMNPQELQKNSMDLNECYDIVSTLSPTIPVEAEINIDWNKPQFQKYQKMRKMGVEINAITNKMKMDGCEVTDIVNPNSSKKPQSSQAFFDIMKKEYFESIWLWITDGTIMNGGDYGEFEKYYWMCGTLNPKRFIARNTGKKIYIKIWVSHYTDDSDHFGEYNLSFYFSDALDLFWNDAISNWERFRSYRIKQFDPNTKKKET